MAGQVTKEYEAHDATMAKYLTKVLSFTLTFEYFGIFYIPK